MRYALILATLCTLFFAGPGFAQTAKPYPNPRPDRAALAAQAAAAELREDEAPVEEMPVETIVDSPSDAATAAITSAISGPPQPVTLSAKISGEGALIPKGVVWRIFATKPNQDGKLQQLETSKAPTAVFNLSPGEYLVHAAYGHAQQTQIILVEKSPVAQTIIMDAGGLRLNAAISGDVAIPSNQVSFAVYPEGAEEDSRSVIASKLPPGEMIHLNAGVYHIVSNYGHVNAVVETNLRVEPGQLTDATLYHNAAQVSFRLVSEAGGDAIADVEWTVTNSDGETVFKELGTFPTTILAEGDYTVLARRSTGVFNRDFAITPGPASEIEVLTPIYNSGG